MAKSVRGVSNSPIHSQIFTFLSPKLSNTVIEAEERGPPGKAHQYLGNWHYCKETRVGRPHQGVSRGSHKALTEGLTDAPVPPAPDPAPFSCPLLCKSDLSICDLDGSILIHVCTYFYVNRHKYQRVGLGGHTISNLCICTCVSSCFMWIALSICDLGGSVLIHFCTYFMSIALSICDLGLGGPSQNISGPRTWAINHIKIFTKH